MISDFLRLCLCVSRHSLIPSGLVVFTLVLISGESVLLFCLGFQELAPTITSGSFTALALAFVTLRGSPWGDTHGRVGALNRACFQFITAASSRAPAVCLGFHLAELGLCCSQERASGSCKPCSLT